MGGYNLFTKQLNVKPENKLIDKYYKNFDKYKIKSVFHEALRNVITREML